MRTAVIYEGPQATLVESDDVVVVGVAGDQVVATARRLVAEGIDRIELCGGLGAIPHSEVVAAVGDAAEIGAVLFGFESLEGIASYKVRFAAGEALRGALLYGDPDAPDGGRRVDDADGNPVVGVRADDIRPVAAALAAEGVQLIEVYAGLSTDAVATAVSASGLPVGVALYPGAR